MLRNVCAVLAAFLLGACGDGGEARKPLPAPPPEPVALIGTDSLEGWIVPDLWIGGGAPVEVTEGVLSIGAGEPMNGLKIDEAKVALPGKPYRIELDAMRVEGSDIFLGLTFPVPERGACVTLIAGGWGGGTTGISSIDYLDASQNSTGSQQEYENDRWYRFRIDVRPERIQVWMDGRNIVDTFIEERKIGMRPGEVEQVQPFGLITWETKAAVRDLTIAELAGNTELNQQR